MEIPREEKLKLLENIPTELFLYICISLLKLESDIGMLEIKKLEHKELRKNIIERIN